MSFKNTDASQPTRNEVPSFCRKKLSFHWTNFHSAASRVQFEIRSEGDGTWCSIITSDSVCLREFKFHYNNLTWRNNHTRPQMTGRLRWHSQEIFISQLDDYKVGQPSIFLGHKTEFSYRILVQLITYCNPADNPVQHLSFALFKIKSSLTIPRCRTV